MNNLEEIHINENEDEDIGCYFLQPSTSPYNITEKLQQANFELFNSTPQATRYSKVKFRDELVSFEPELTDDDVNSIESDHVADDLPQITEEVALLSSYDTVLRETVVDIEEEIEETVLEESLLLTDEVESLNNKTENNSKEEIINLEKTSPINEGTSKRSKSSKRKNKSTSKKQDIHCKEHCIERLDTHLSMSIKKLEIHEKVNLPPLQLHQRKCCDSLKQSNTDRNLPNYKGCRSEYGLSSRQIKNRDRYMEMLRQKELSRQKLIEDYRALRIQQNEEVFCQWLKQVSKRNKEQQIKRSGNLYYEFLDVEKAKERPKTAGFTPKTNIKKKKRPHTSQVYIEVSPDVLKKGISIGDLLVTNSKALTKKLHILTI